MKSPIVVKLTHTESETGILSFSLSNTNKKHREQDLSSPFHFFLNPIEERKKESVKKKKKAKIHVPGGRGRLMIPLRWCRRVRSLEASEIRHFLSRERAHTSATKPWRDGRANNNEDNQSAVGRKGILWGGRDRMGAAGNTLDERTPLPSSFRRRYRILSLCSFNESTCFTRMQFSSTMIGKPPHGGFKRTRRSDRGCFKSVNDV